MPGEVGANVKASLRAPDLRPPGVPPGRDAAERTQLDVGAGSLAADYAAWLFRFIDRRDWGHRSRRAGVRPSATNDQLMGRWSQRLTARLIASHLAGTDRLYYRSRRDSGYALLRIDIDAHKRQTDARSAAEFVAQVVFTGAYSEPSDRGYPVYALIDVGYCRRDAFNALAAQFESDLSRVLAGVGYRSTVEVQGRFTLIDWDRREVLNRAKQGALRYRAKTFDPARACEAGFEHWRPRLIEAVRAHCRDRTCRCSTHIGDEDLAIGLYVVQRNSFKVQDDPKHQFTCEYGSFAGMAEALKAAGLTSRLFGNRNKTFAVKQILERAGLIECIDRQYVAAGPHDGVGQKFTVGPNHWRYAEFVRWAEGIRVEYVRAGAGVKQRTKS